MMVIKKNRGVTVGRDWGRAFRGHNVIEYKSPSAPALSIYDFDKAVHGYAGVYASQNKISRADMSATMLCHKKPVKLFRILENNFNYKVLRKYDGVYYIVIDGVAAEKDLAAQIVVYSEISREDYGSFLNAMAPAGADMATIKEIESMSEADKEALELPLKIMETNNRDLLLTFYEEGDMKSWKEFWERADEKGMLEENNQKYLQAGRQETLALIEKGYSVEEIKRKLQLA
jgi:hypothetical protein